MGLNKVLIQLLLLSSPVLQGVNQLRNIYQWKALSMLHCEVMVFH